LLSLLRVLFGPLRLALSRRCGRARALPSLRFVLLAHHAVARTIGVVLALEHALLVCVRIAITRIFPLIDGERSGTAR